ncbi:MAG: hypothetical protein AUI89_05465 [Gemmatimonadetes bacterium 13_1_40CM_3_65_8]|nr:MAG: hypothetical protein AUH75_01990 [Gemmatimonadetes bacterium 13_1_40CM_4_65_7]OLD00779.1 MAG: hypothetical protein AUI89_05465 [Gemmatimonadetes bacterium 13_1_40CM_3_65_8]
MQWQVQIHATAADGDICEAAPRTGDNGSADDSADGRISDGETRSGSGEFHARSGDKGSAENSADVRIINRENRSGRGELVAEWIDCGQRNQQRVAQTYDRRRVYGDAQLSDNMGNRASAKRQLTSKRATLYENMELLLLSSTTAELPDASGDSVRIAERRRGHHTRIETDGFPPYRRTRYWLTV